MSTETYIRVKSDIHRCTKRYLYQCQKKLISVSKIETYVCDEIDLFVTKKTYNRDLQLMIFPWPSNAEHMSNETYIHVKRDPYQFQKRPMFVTKVTHNRDLRLMIFLAQ